MIIQHLRKTNSFLFVNQTTNQTILKNLTWLTIGKLGGRLLRVIIVIYAARILGATDWGMFSYAANLIAIFAVITDFGISPVLTRETSVGRGDTKSNIISNTFYVKIFFLSPAIIFLIFYASQLSVLAGMAPILGLFALMLVFDTFRQLGFSIIKAREQMEIQAGLHLLTNACIVIFGFIFLMQSPSIPSLAYAYTLGSAVGVLATWTYLHSYIKSLFSNFNWIVVKEILSSAWPFAITAALGSIMISTDIFIIGLLKPVQEVGMYSVADKIIQLFYAPALILVTSMFPTLSRLAQTESQRLITLVMRTLKYIMLVGLPVSIVGILLAPWIVNLLFGQQYALSVLPLQILLVTLVARFVSVILGHVFFAYKRRDVLVKFALLGILTNTVLDIFFIPPFGIAGAAMATLLAQSVNTLYIVWEFRREAFRLKTPHGIDPQSL